MLCLCFFCGRRKDVKGFFGVFKKKFHFFAWPITFALNKEIIYAFYCCQILHNITLKESIDSNEAALQCSSCYICMEEMINNVEEEQLEPHGLA
jgi:hypothetical protein